MLSLVIEHHRSNRHVIPLAHALAVHRRHSGGRSSRSAFVLGAVAELSPPRCDEAQRACAPPPRKALTPPNVALVQHIVVDEACRVNHLHDLREALVAVRDGAAARDRGEGVRRQGNLGMEVGGTLRLLGGGAFRALHTGSPARAAGPTPATTLRRGRDCALEARRADMAGSDCTRGLQPPRTAGAAGPACIA
eukprot:364687-Chlamydomonas_euryale.AAC.6